MILAVLVIAVGYWKLILTPINDSIADLNAQTASEQDAILTNSARLSRMRQMQQELETLLADPDAKPLPDYDNSERLLVELNTILSGTVDYTLSFGDTYLLEDGGSIICRPISLEYTCGSYTAARTVMDALHGSDYVNLISDVTLDPGRRARHQGEPHHHLFRTAKHRQRILTPCAAARLFTGLFYQDLFYRSRA